MVIIPELFNMTQDGLYVGKMNRARVLRDHMGREDYVERQELGIFELKVVPGYWSDVKELEHTWNVTSISNDTMEI